jgi:plastocyanin
MEIEGTSRVTRTAADARPFGGLRSRTTAMWLLPIAALIEVLITIQTMRSIGFLPPLVVFVVLLVVIAVRALARPGPRVFLIGGIVVSLFVATNFPFIIDGLMHPIGTIHAWTDIIALVAGVAGSIGGFAAFIELRRGAPVVRAMRSPTGEAMLILAVGAILGTSYVSVLGFAALEGTPGLGVANGVLKAPTQAPAELDAAGSAFIQKSLQLSTGPGTVYVVNADASPHTFDIELNGHVLSYPVPGHSTTGVVLDLTPGSYTYWCAIPGHRSTMEGTLDVVGS